MEIMLCKGLIKIWIPLLKKTKCFNALFLFAVCPQLQTLGKLNSSRSAALL